jgi:mono/diheme cytochrome c family protein
LFGNESGSDGTFLRDDFLAGKKNTDCLTFSVVMKLSRSFLGAVIGVIFIGTSLPAATNTVVTTPPVYVPNLSNASGALPDSVLAWDATSKETNVMANTSQAHFVFNFTNVATQIKLGLVTNVTGITNFTTVTNSSFWVRLFGKKITQLVNVASQTNIVTVTNSLAPIPVTILSVRPSCGCTTTKLPPLPWTLAPGTNGQIEATVNLTAPSGTLYKTLAVSTDKGSKMLMLKITIQPFVMPAVSEAERARNMQTALANRQAVFKGECITCHVRQGDGKYGQALYEADCAICHESEHRATMVPDLHALKTPTNFEFWRTWITHGKPGSLMPAFSTLDGGPLSDMQIASLANYLSAAIPSKSLPSSK